MINVKINNELYHIKNTGEIITCDRRAINPREWRATSIIIKEDSGKFKDLKLNEITSPLSGPAYLRSEEHGCPKLLEIQSLSVEQELNE